MTYIRVLYTIQTCLLCHICACIRNKLIRYVPFGINHLYFLIAELRSTFIVTYSEDVDVRLKEEIALMYFDEYMEKCAGKLLNAQCT